MIVDLGNHLAATIIESFTPKVCTTVQKHLVYCLVHNTGYVRKLTHRKLLQRINKHGKIQASIIVYCDVDAFAFGPICLVLSDFPFRFNQGRKDPEHHCGLFLLSINCLCAGFVCVTDADPFRPHDRLPVLRTRSHMQHVNDRPRGPIVRIGSY
jgi:hypothetical protein